jgi:hypothetical protein
MRSFALILCLIMLFSDTEVRAQPSPFLRLVIDTRFDDGVGGASIEEIDSRNRLSIPIPKGAIKQLKVLIATVGSNPRSGTPFTDTARLRFFLPNNPPCAGITETTGILTVNANGRCNAGTDTLVLAVFVLTPDLQDVQYQNFFLFRVQ